jgi:uncharacterized membrane protein YccC
MTADASTQYLQLATEKTLHALSAAAHLSLNDLQRALKNPNSQMHALYESLLLIRTTEHTFAQCHELINARETRLTQKEIKLTQETVRYTALAREFQADYQTQLNEISEARVALQALKEHYALLETGIRTAKEKFVKAITQLAEQFSEMRHEIKNAFLTGGMSRFNQKNIDDTLSYILNLTEKPYHYGQ